MTNRELGLLGENLTEQMLLAKGYQILERNWRVREGEVDLIALDGDEVVFVEVKARVGDAHGTPDEAVNEAKQNRLGKLGQLYMSQAESPFEDLSWRIDVVAISFTPGYQVKTIHHYRDAVRFDG